MVRIPATAGPVGFYPFLDVDVSLGRGRVQQRLTAILDSGADRTVVPRLIVEALGANYGALPLATDGEGNPMRAEGPSGEFEIRVCRGKVRWRGKTVCDSFWVANPRVVLLGRDDFFKLYDVTFDWSAAFPYMDIEPAGTLRAREDDTT